MGVESVNSDLSFVQHNHIQRRKQFELYILILTNEIIIMQPWANEAQVIFHPYLIVHL